MLPTKLTFHDPDIPHSIFEIPGARECAIELRSFSKNGGFTGRALRVHRHAEIGAGADGERPQVAAPSALASALEHEIEQRELSGAARRRGFLFTRRPQANARA